jgi:small ligand-binding sensory domain FIST
VPAAAVSVVLRGESPARVAASLADSFRAAGSSGAGLVFLGGTLGERVEDVAHGLARAGLNLPLLVAAGAGVISERGELEGEPAAAGLVFGGGRPETLVTRAANHDDAATLLAARLSEAARGVTSTAFVCVRADGFGVDSLEPLRAVRSVRMIGAGTPGPAPVAAVNRDGQVELGTQGALLVKGLTPARVRSSPACRLLTPLRPITAARGPLLAEIGGEPALDVLKNAAEHLAGQPLILMVLAPEHTPDDAHRSELLVRGIQGVDPARRAIVLSGDLEVGWRVAFAVRDAATARTDLELCARELGREAGGAAPLFGIYVSCASRGAGLYGSPDVDLRVIRGRFPEMPLIGLHSAFEIAPFEGKPSVHFYTGVIALFTQPS